MNIGLMVPLPGANPAPGAVVDQIVRAEALGFHSVWAPNIRGNDALTVLAVAGTRTARIELGTFVVPTYPRHPSALAQQALTAAALTGNRLTLGIGLSHRVTMEELLGFDWSHPIRHTREYLACLLPLLRGEAATFRGEEYRIDGYSLAVPGAAAPPVLVAALGPQMLRLAGRHTAGTAIWMGGPRYLAEHAAPVLNAAAAAPPGGPAGLRHRAARRGPPLRRADLRALRATPLLPRDPRQGRCRRPGRCRADRRRGGGRRGAARPGGGRGDRPRRLRLRPARRGRHPDLRPPARTRAGGELRAARRGRGLHRQGARVAESRGARA